MTGLAEYVPALGFHGQSFQDLLCPLCLGIDHDQPPEDGKLSLNDIDSSTGGPIPPHATHDLGRTVDMRYVDPNGNTTNNVLNADDNRCRDMVGTFKANGFNQNYSDNKQSYGTGWAPGHANHIHFGKDAHTAGVRDQLMQGNRSICV
jgi:hypothetical protein